MEILEKIPITKFDLFVAIISFIIVFVIIVIIGMILEFELKFESASLLGILCGIIIGMLVSAYLSEEVFPEETGEYTYKIKIDETVSMLEFNKEYKIISEEGNIFICEKNNHEENAENKLEENIKDN